MPLVSQPIGEMAGQAQSQRDEITKILKNNSGGPSIGDMADSAAQRISKAYGRRDDAKSNDEVYAARQASELSGPMAQLKVMEEGAAAGAARTKAVLDSFGQFADNPDDLAKLVAAAHDDPEQIDESNAATWAARKAAELGFKSTKKMQAEAQLNYSKAKLDGSAVPVVSDGAPMAGLPSDLSLIPDNGKPVMPPVSGTGVPDKALMTSGTVPGAAAPASPAAPAPPAAKPDNMKRYAQVKMNGQIVKAGQGSVFLVDPATNQIVGKEKIGVAGDEKPLKKDEKADLKTAADTYDSLSRAFGNFKPEYAQIGGKGIGGAALRKGQEIFSSDPKNVERIGWWKDYNAFENIFRHSLFGSALTAGEQAQWERANFDENTNPATVQKSLETKQNLAKMAIGRAVGQLVAAGKSREEIAAATGFDPSELDDISSWGKHETMKPTAAETELFEGFSHLSPEEQKRARELMGKSSGAK